MRIRTYPINASSIVEWLDTRGNYCEVKIDPCNLPNKKFMEEAKKALQKIYPKEILVNERH